jgi:hypothetical protein
LDRSQERHFRRGNFLSPGPLPNLYRLDLDPGFFCPISGQRPVRLLWVYANDCLTKQLVAGLYPLPIVFAQQFEKFVARLLAAPAPHLIHTARYLCQTGQARRAQSPVTADNITIRADL